jgi:3-hydroxyisobutyrate dehydrogenase-like beta-hydroxyacid dehydrogenase
MEQIPGKTAAGVIGLGIIGSRVAACLRRAGHQVWLWNRTVRPEPNFLSSPAEIAEAARHIQIFVSNGEALHSVLRAMLPALTPEHVILNHATVSPADTLTAAGIVGEKHAAFLDAPFTGSRDAAAAGQLVYYIGGDPQALERVRPQLEASSKQILEIGGLGQASVVKVATNLISANAVASLTEALALLDRYGVELHKLSLALENNAARSGVIDLKLPCMLGADFDPRFSLKNMFKDVQIGLAMAEEKDIELPAAGAFAGIAMAGLQRGWGDEDFSVISRFYDFPGQGHTIPETPAPSASASVSADDATHEPAGLKNLWGLLRWKK